MVCCTMDIIQVTNPKFRPQTMRSIIVANARHELQLASQMRTLGYHRRTFLAKNERERKCLMGQLAEMTTIMDVRRPRRRPSWMSDGRDDDHRGRQMAEMTTIMGVRWPR